MRVGSLGRGPGGAARPAETLHDLPARVDADRPRRLLGQPGDEPFRVDLGSSVTGLPASRIDRRGGSPLPRIAYNPRVSSHAEHRRQHLAFHPRAGTVRYDLVVVGGGIHGAGVAQAAAAAGHSVLVLERKRLAHGTSSRSSKLIHGGLRYLESGQLRLVRESLEERSLMLRLAPELVRIRPFFIPVYPSTRRRPWQLTVGLSAYAALAGFGRTTRFGRLPRRQWDHLDGLDTKGLQCVFRYFDAQTDDERLTRAVMNSALGLGAELVVPAEFLHADVRADGVQVRYLVGAEARECSARVVVNAAGPWAPFVSERVSPPQRVPALDLVQGTHIVLPGQIQRGVYYVESPTDGRAVFVIPWRDAVMVGTTETLYRGDPDAVRPLPQELEYLRGVIAHYFPAYGGPGAPEVASAFAGLRVLPSAQGTAFHRTRETLLETDAARSPRFLAIYGGKLTGWRATAERVLHRLEGTLPARVPRADTRELRIEPP
jgi:glycerol-3-phosphate dehydrogenase